MKHEIEIYYYPCEHPTKGFSKKMQYNDKSELWYKACANAVFLSNKHGTRWDWVGHSNLGIFVE